jgi:hypothetical protein
MGHRLNPVCTPAETSCPFNTPAYAAGLGHLGAVEMHPGGRFPVLRRPVPGTSLWDGVGPWPYLWVGAPSDLDALREDFPHLVTLTVVTQPGYVPKARFGDAVLLKQHFVYDPTLPPPAMSRRARGRLRRCEAAGTFEVVSDRGAWRAMTDAYTGLVRRRRLTGSLFDMPGGHFEAIADLDKSVLFRVRDAAGTGAMACGVVFGGLLQILHTATTESGLTWNASYLLMHGLQTFSRELGVRLLLGGMPESGTDGLRIFKARWVNSHAPVYLLRIVNDPARYAALCSGASADASFFPAYRNRP